MQIPEEKLPGMIGKKIHASWAHSGCVWILDRIEGSTLHCHTPSTGKKVQIKKTEACYTREMEEQLTRNTK